MSCRIDAKENENSPEGKRVRRGTSTMFLMKRPVGRIPKAILGVAGEALKRQTQSICILAHTLACLLQELWRACIKDRTETILWSAATRAPAVNKDEETGERTHYHLQ